MGTIQRDVGEVSSPWNQYTSPTPDVLLWTPHIHKDLGQHRPVGTTLTKTPSEFHALLKELARSNDQCTVEKRLMRENPAIANATTSKIYMYAMKEMMAQMADLKK